MMMMQDDARAIGLFKIKSHVNLFNIWIWFILSFKYGFGQYCLRKLKKKNYMLIQDCHMLNLRIQINGTKEQGWHQYAMLVQNINFYFYF